jgi:uncharacterized protein YecE (DUF72 family)
LSALKVGCSGWIYQDWTGPFYPPAVKGADRLAWYARTFDTAEINASFYRLPSEAAVAAWKRNTPEGFCFAWKVSRFISHNKKLKDCADSVELVFGRMRPLGAKLGPALVQLPPRFKANVERLEQFVAWLPDNVRCTFEFRDDSWYAEPVLDVLRRHNLALCISDHHHAPAPWVATADWVYVRGHGPGGRYFGRYSQEELRAWAEKVESWRAQGRDVFCYFDNDVKCAAPQDAQALLRILEPHAAN